MKTLLTAIALTAITASAACAQPYIQYFKTIPSSLAPAITTDPSPGGSFAGDFIPRDADPAIHWQLLHDSREER